jgi:hypothetical protein
MQLSNNNMEIRSIQFHVPFPPDCFFFQEFFFMGGAIHPFPKIMRGEIAFFWGGWCNSPLPKNYERSGGFDERAQGSSSACSLVRIFWRERNSDEQERG